MEGLIERQIGITKGYKHSALGMIPVDWEVFEFGDIAQIEKGKYIPKLGEDR